MVRVQLAWAAVMTASWATTVSLTVVAYDAGGSAAVALAVLVRAGVAAALGPGVGALVDRVPRARSMTWAAATCAVASAGAALAGSAVVPVVVLSAAVAVAVLAFRTAQSAVLPELVDDPADLTAANVLSSAVESLGLFAGPALAGLLLALHGSSLSFAVAAVLFAAASGVLVGMRASSASAGAGGGAAAAGSTREVLRLRAPRLLLSLVLAQTTVAGGLVVLSAALVVETLEVDLGAVGLLNSAFGLGCVAGSLGLFALAGSSRLGGWTVAALLLWAVPLLLVPAAPGLAAVVILLLVVGAGNVLFDVTVTTLLQRAVPGHLTGRAFGALETAVVLGLTLGAVVAPALERLGGPDRALSALGGALVLVAVAGVRPLRRIDRELAAPARQVALLQGLAPFALLPTPQLEALALRLQRRERAAGDVVVRQGETGTTFFVIDRGVLAVTVDGRDVAALGAGESFGEIALLRDGTRTATITARTPVVLWELEGDRFLATLGADDGQARAAADQVVRALLQRAAPEDRHQEDDTDGRQVMSERPGTGGAPGVRLRVVVLGAGFGGLEVATTLATELGTEVDVVLLDAAAGFVFGFSKLDVMFGRTSAEHVIHPYAAVERPGLRFVRARVLALDPVARRVTTDEGTFDADVLVVALGADLDPAATPGLVEGGHDFYSLGSALALREVLDGFAGGRVVIGVTSTPFKCPPAPSETALLMHDLLDRRGLLAASHVSLVMPFGVPIPPSPHASQAVLAAFAERGISWHPERTVLGLDPVRRVALLSGGQELAYDLFLGVPVHRAPRVVVEAGMTVDGWIPVDPLSLETRFPDVYAVGDVTSVGTPKAGVFAEGQAAVVAAAICARVRGTAPTRTYDGRGVCYMEFGDDRIATVDVTFVSGRPPTGVFAGPSSALAADKRAFGSSRAERWFARGWTPLPRQRPGVTPTAALPVP